MSPPAGEKPRRPAINPPTSAPTIPRIMSTKNPKPPPFMIFPVSHPAINPTRIHHRKCILPPFSFAQTAECCALEGGGSPARLGKSNSTVDGLGHLPGLRCILYP